MLRVSILAAAILAAVPQGAEAAQKLNAGPYGNTKYQTTYAGSKTFQNQDGSVTVTMDDIETINCSGCETVHYYPGSLFHARNNTNKPLCISFVFKLSAGEYNGVTSWGNGEVFLLKPRQSISKFAGITMTFSRRTANLGWTGGVGSWTPIDKKTCGKNPYV